jgi:molybdenum cofactor synthesis domain-containing protein
MPRIAIVVIGNEILSGKVEDQNAKFAIALFREIGADLERIVVVPDGLTEIAGEVRACSSAYDYVITSGGVGPTHDDITYEGVAGAFGVPLIEEQKVAHILRGYFGAALTDDHLRMARFPQGSEVHMREGLPIPIVSIRNVFVLPGIPYLFRDSLNALRDMFRGRAFYLQDVFCSKDEGEFAAGLRKIQVSFPDVNLGSYPGRDAQGTFQVRITVEGRVAESVERAAAAVRALLAEPADSKFTKES